MQQTNTMAEKDILQDCLSSQKLASANYNTFAGECKNEQLRTTMLSILNDEHQIQSDIFHTMHTNGWYPVEAAEQNKIQQTKQKFNMS